MILRSFKNPKAICLFLWGAIIFDLVFASGIELATNQDHKRGYACYHLLQLVDLPHQPEPGFSRT